MCGLIADVRWHDPEIPDLSDYEGWIQRDAPPRSWHERLVRFLLRRREYKPTRIPAHGYEKSTNRTACFFDLVLREPLPLGRYAAHWGWVDSVVDEGGIRPNDAWPLPRELNEILLRMVGCRFRVINPQTLLLSCWISGQPDDLGWVLQRIKERLGLEGELVSA